MVKRILWFFMVGVFVFVFIRTFPFEDPKLFWFWLTDAAFAVRNVIESVVGWMFSFGSPADTVETTEGGS